MKAKELHEMTVDELNTKLKELKEEYAKYRHEMDYSTFDEWFDKMLDLGRQKVGGLVEI